METRPFIIGLSVAACLWINGCGFQLRGNVTLPENVHSVHVQAPSRELSNEIQLFLESSGARVASHRGDADAVLSVQDERFNRRVLSVDPRTGKEREFELAYTAMFGLTRADGTVLVEQQTVSLLRDFVFDEDALLGKAQEEGLLRNEMRRDAVEQMLRRVRAALVR